MRATIITIGDELLGGETVDTNSAYIARRLGELGVGVRSMVSVADRPEEISPVVDRAARESDLVVVTGGLGPTVDDVTKQAIALAAGRELKVDKQLLEHLEERFRDHSGVRPGVLESLAAVPEGARTLGNPVGAAAGLALTHKGTTIYVLPGVPHEMEAIFEGSIAAELKGLALDRFRKTRLVRTIGLRESVIAERLQPMMPLGGIALGYLPRTAGVDLRLTASAADEAGADSLLDEAVARIVGPLGQHVFSTEGEPLHTVVGRMLIERGMTIAIAESCTGGLVGHLLTEVAGISASLERDIVAYSNTAKAESLGVDRALIHEHGAVSAEVAEAMASGVRRLAGADLGVSTTGIAGPDGGTREKPVGLVYMGFAWEGGSQVAKNVFRGTREMVKQRAAARVLDMIRCHLLDTGA
jgi:nicotinamide-nucleotide amidase